MLVYNPTTQKHTVRVYGNHFEFAPGMVKSMDDKIGQFLIHDRSYMGFVELPEVCVTEPTSKESKDAKDAAKKLGIARRIEFLNKIVHNEEVSLRQDLDKNNNSSNTSSFANKQLLEQYKELAGYQQAKDDEDKQMQDELNKYKEAIQKAK